MFPPAVAQHSRFRAAFVTACAQLRSTAVASVDTGGRTFLIGGGSQSPAYRRRVADLTDRVIVVPHDKQLVASGAAAQAAAILAAEPVDQTAQRWSLGTGVPVEPVTATDHGAARSRYRDARDALFPA